MLDKIRKILVEECKIDENRPLLVGVSGGPDSLALAHLIRSFGYKIIIAHLNHGLREEAKDDAHAVMELSKHWKVPFRLEQADVADYAGEHSLSIEESGRILRYRFLFNQAEEDGAYAVAVGHSANDQVETVLMHLLRGAGLSGLKGMQIRSFLPQWNPTIPLLRPLLPIWREEIIDYCEENELEPRFDRSNLDKTYFRNRLRLYLIPELASFNPKFNEVIWRMSNSLASDHQIVQDRVDKVWEECIVESGDGFVGMSHEKLLEQPLGIKRNLVREAIGKIRPDLRDVDFAAIERAIDFIETPTKNYKQDLIAGTGMVLEDDIVWFAVWEANLPNMGWPQLKKKSRWLEYPGRIKLPDDWEFKVDLVSNLEPEIYRAFSNPDPFEAWLDGENMNKRLILRGRKSGDRFNPLGLEGHSVKLSDFYINHKLPQRARNKWPVVFSGKEIVWVPGLRQSYDYRLREKSEKIYKFSLKKKGSTEVSNK